MRRSSNTSFLPGRSAAIAEQNAFDVVIVGGGAAGCVLAARLSERSSRSVLLVEAGPDLRSDPVEALRDAWRTNEQFDWGYASEPDARGMVESLRRGRLLGGSSWVTRFALRGSPADYDEWADLGNPGWRFDDVLRCFTRLERPRGRVHGGRGGGPRGARGGRVHSGRRSQRTASGRRWTDAHEFGRGNPRHAG
jgi:choline dehydrogenase